MKIPSFKLPSFDLTEDNKRLIVGGLMFLVIGGALLSPIQLPGWENKTGLVSVDVNSVRYTESSVPRGGNFSWGASFIKFDPDNLITGIPTLSVQLGPPVEYVMQDGQWEKARPGEEFKALPVVEIGQDRYFFYQHVFFMELQIVAEADYQSAGTRCQGEAKGMEGAIKPTINVRFIYQAGTWRVLSHLHTENGLAQYLCTGVWTGVMSASVTDLQGGYCSPLPAGFAGIPGMWSLTNTGPVNMYKVDNSQEPAKGLDDFQSEPAEIAGVPSQVYISVDGTSLQPGWWWPLFGAVGSYAVEAKYRLRVDVVTSAKYSFQQGDQDDKLKAVSVSDNASRSPLWDLLDWVDAHIPAIGASLVGLGAFAIIVLVLLIIYRRSARSEHD